MAVGKAATEFSWYGGDYSTDTDFVDLEPEARANPSRASWGYVTSTSSAASFQRTSFVGGT